MKFIIGKKIKHYTKEFSKIFSIMAIGFTFIIAIIFVKYKPIYEVTINGEEVGYIKNKMNFEEKLQAGLSEMDGKNVEFASYNSTPSYELKLLDRNEDTNEEEIALALKEDIEVTYKCYEVIFNQKEKTYVDTLEEAEQVVKNIKEEHQKDLELDLQIAEKYTDNIEELKTETTEKAEENIEKMVEEKKKEEEMKKKPSVNGIKMAVTPVSGKISSRYGVSSRIRKSTHTGLDIACSTGTPIKAVNSGKVTFSGYKGSYGNLVKIDHGNGVETWYAHCSKLYVKAGKKVEAGEKIAAVGSTGNSTGPHLHLEIRINGKTLNPQKYLYK